MKKPEFFLVGAPKAGTTSMTRYLRKHPEIFIPAEINTSYFPEDVAYDTLFEGVESRSQYLSRFKSVSREMTAGDTTNISLYSRKASEKIYNFNPRAKIIIMLRDPIEMMYSLHSHYLFGGNEDVEDFKRALELESRRKRGEVLPESVRFREGLYYRKIANFYPQVKRYLDTFEQKQIKIILFKDFTEKTEAVYRNTLEFIGVDSSFTPELEAHNKNKKIRFKRLHRFVRNPPDFIKWFLRKMDNLVPGSLFRKYLDFAYRWINTANDTREELDPNLREKLEGEFSDSIQKLSELLGRDLDHWFKYT